MTPENWLARTLLSRVWVLARGLTFGVRGAVLDGDGRVLLVRHSYTPGWQMPGGGVEIGETAEGALRRELQEEAKLRLTAVPALHGLFHHPQLGPRDHVAVYVVREFAWDGMPEPNAEIREVAWFDPGELPESTTLGTRRRLAEILDGAPISERW